MLERLVIAGAWVGVLVAVVAAPARDARAAGPFVDAPLTLPPLKFSADVGVGFGTYQNFQLDPADPTKTVPLGGTQVGWGTSLEAAVGLPVVGELGVRIGYRFGPDVTGIASASFPAGALAQADHFGRLFDPVVSEPGLSAFANPEIRLRGSLFDLKTVQLGLETRIIVPTADGSVFALTPGVPVRVHLPGFLRVDTGLYLPITFGKDPSGSGGIQPSYTLDVPAQAFFQVGDAFFGPVTGVRYNVVNQPGESNSVDIPLGVAGGYTLAGGTVDLKVQVRTERINDGAWASQFLGGGLGAGLRLP